MQNTDRKIIMFMFSWFLSCKIIKFSYTDKNFWLKIDGSEFSGLLEF